LIFSHLFLVLDFNPIELCFGWVKRRLIAHETELHGAVQMGASFPDLVANTFLDLPSHVLPGFYAHSLQEATFFE